MIKEKPPYPFEVIATALALSPRAEAVLNESKKLADIFNAKLLLIHVGEKNKEKERKFTDMIKSAGIENSSIDIIWKDERVAETILDVCKTERVDLLVLGAIHKESLFKYYLGSVARKLCRKAKCSLLLITEPNINGQTFNHIVANGVKHIKTKYSVQTALYFSEKTKAKTLTLMGEIDTKNVTQHDNDKNSLRSLNKERNKSVHLESDRLKKLVSNYPGKYNCTINNKYIFGKIGHSIGQFAQTIRADLLVVNSPGKKLRLIDRIFPHDIEYILGDMPCNLLIVHSRNNDD
jgi:nucleotide-binding universal stress UspA family protein